MTQEIPKPLPNQYLGYETALSLNPRRAKKQGKSWVND